MLKTIAAAVVGLVALLAPAQSAGLPMGKVVFRNYSSESIIVDVEGAEVDALVLLPYRGKGTYRVGAYDTNKFLLDADGDLNADGSSTINLNGTKKTQVTIGDFGIVGLGD